MYQKSIPFKDFKGNPRNEVVHFNLTEREIFKNLVELQAIFDWRDRIKSDKTVDLPVEDVVEFYNNFEKILLEAWGVPSEDGLHFRKDGRYDFEESALFAACMVEFVSNPEETFKLIDQIIPKGLQDMVQKADSNTSKMIESSDVPDDLRSEVERLQARLREVEGRE